MHSFQPLVPPTVARDSTELGSSTRLLPQRAGLPAPPGVGEVVRSTGSLRERRPGVWEIRIAVG